ncbi:hypothetical protein D5086_018770 [Populus alba]|uniref:Uncharacterized protein n=1 Tax=Populus alba TaxID=43335 RepID=A0ACC4BRD5_POPAL
MFVVISFNGVLSHLKHRSPASYIAVEYPETQTLIIEFYMEIAEAFATHPGTDQPTPRLCKSMNRHRNSRERFGDLNPGWCLINVTRRHGGIRF